MSGVPDPGTHIGVKCRETIVSNQTQSGDYFALSQQVKQSGLLDRRYVYYWAKLGSVPVICAACFLAFILIGSSWWQMFTAVVFAGLFTQIAFLGHDAAHRQIFRSGRWNDWTSLILANLFVGFSYGWWQHKHTRHHANPNMVGSDPDLAVPAITFTAPQVAAARTPLLRWLIAHQGIFFFPVLPFEGLSLHASSVRRLFLREHLDRRWAEIGFLFVRIVGYLAMVILVLSPDKAAVFLAIQLGLFGVCMGMSFAPNHKGMPVVPHSMRIDFLRRQVMMSRNIRGNRVIDFAMGGLNYQIEHHLFPSMARPNLRKAAPMIAAYCAARGVPYTQTGLGQSYGIVIRYINRVGIGAADPFECPLLEERQTPVITTVRRVTSG
jgi:fatty acid desaturase